jgi:hypothetical protein
MKRFFLNFIILVSITSFINSTNGNSAVSSHIDTDKVSYDFLISFIKKEASFSLTSNNDSGNIAPPSKSIIMLDIDSLQLDYQNHGEYHMKSRAISNLNSEEEILSLDQELRLENWMLEVFELEKMDQDLNLEDWMLKPFDNE